LFKIGEFSRITQVSSRLLRYYDEINLFKPAHIDSVTGFRYYNATQLQQLNRILALRDIGLPLEQICELVNRNVSATEIREILLKHKQQIEHTIEAEQTRLNRVEQRLAHLDGTTDQPEHNIRLKSIDALKVYSFREPHISLPELEQLSMETVSYVARSKRRAALGNAICIMHSPEFNPDDMDMEFGFTALSTTPDKIPLPRVQALQLRTLPSAETMVTVIINGTGSELCAFQTMAAWIENNGYSMSGPSRELVLHWGEDPAFADMVREFQIPVARQA
jgi:DNA-binding transcriptional MerR regulator